MSSNGLAQVDEDRERLLRDQLMRARQPAASPDAPHQRPPPPPSSFRANGDHTDSYRPHSDNRERRASPSYDRYAPGPPPQRDHYVPRYDQLERGPPPRWQMDPPQQGRSRDDGYGRHPETSRRPDEENGVPPPGAWGRRPPRPEGGSNEGQYNRPPPPMGDAGGDFFASRNQERMNSNISIWPPSPTSPYHSESEDERKRKSSRKSKHSSSSKSKHDKHSSSSKHRHSSSKRSRHRDESSELDSEEEAYRRRKRREKERDRDDRGSHRSRSDRHSKSSRRDDDDEERRRRRRERSRSERSDGDKAHRHRSSRRRSRSVSESSDSDAGKDKKAVTVSSNKNGLQIGDVKKVEDDAAASDDDIGPRLPVNEEGRPIDPRAYGGALMPGEGSAMAAYIQDGKRIPRRGEIGLSSEQIEDYEQAGFVMSGSRHARMNAVRMRKENQVISAEEKRTLLKQRNEEKEKKEREIQQQFREMLDQMQPSQ